MTTSCLVLWLSIGFSDPALVIRNATIETFDPLMPKASAIAMREGKVIAIGAEGEVMSAAGANPNVIDAGGRPLLRGFFDAHAHLMNGGLARLRLELLGCKNETELVDRVRHWQETLPFDEWVIGGGFDQTLFPSSQWPTRIGLDELAPNRPIFLKRIDGHSALVNGAALRTAGIDEKTPNPPNGEIVRDDSGEPTGLLKEGAVDLVERVIPPLSFDRKLEALRRALVEAAEVGITSCADHGGDAEVYLEIQKRGELTCRVDLWCDLSDDLSQVIELRKRLEPHRDWIRFETLKGFVDGTFGSRTAAMFEAFHDDAGATGILAVEPEVLDARVKAADAAGFQVALHAIGDRAVALALDAFEKASQTNGTKERRHRIEHAQVLRPADIPRFQALGVTASVQPCHLLTDRRFAVDRIGEERAKSSYPWASLEKSGALLAFGSDFPVEPLAPMRNLFAAITRLSEDETSEAAYFPAECVSLETALRASTIGPAIAAHRERELGPLTVGSLADIVVLERPLDPKQPRAILENRAWLTIVAGKVVFQR